MGHLSRLLGELSRKKLVGLRHSRNPHHLASCWECRAAVVRERQYIERLRSAAVPEASQDLRSRLLEQTRRLAEAPDMAARQSAWSGSPGPYPRSSHQAPARSTGSTVAKLVGISASGALLLAGILAAAAYTVAGEPLPQSGRASTSRQGDSLAALAHAALPPVAESPSPRAEDSSGAGPAAESGSASQPGVYFVAGRTVPLTAAELTELREQGWACPELPRLGYHLDGATASVRDGGQAVELRLSNGVGHATILEEHRLPVAVQIGRDELRVTQGPPWQAVYRTPSAVFTYYSDLPADQADDAVPELVEAATALRPSSTASPSSDPEGLPDRLLRGLRTLAGLAGF